MFVNTQDEPDETDEADETGDLAHYPIIHELGSFGIQVNLSIVPGSLLIQNLTKPDDDPDELKSFEDDE